MARITIILFSLAFFCHTELHARQGTGAIAGKVADGDSRHPLPGVHLYIPELERGSVSGEHGSFRFNEIPPGVYSMRISYIGYWSRQMTDIIVRPNRTQSLELSLQPSVVEGGEVTVTPGYFHQDEIQPVSRVEMNTEEIRRSPGAGQELARVMTTAAGVASAGDMSQDLIVRGGSPRENAFYVDHIYLPGVRHFESVDGASHGPIGLINTGLVDALEFSTGGYSASYGGHMSSVADIRYRQGSRERTQGSIDMNMAGFGGTFETPLAGGDGSLLISGRRSYLDLLADALNASGAPRYGDIQGKGVYDPDSENRLTFLQIYGDSKITTSLEEARQEGYPTYPQMHNRQNTSGVNWRRLWSESIHSNTSLSYSFREQNLQTFHSEQGEREHRFNNRHDYVVFRHTSYWKASGRHRVEFGSDAMFTGGSFDYYYAPVVNEANVTRPEVHRRLDKRQFTGEVFGTYVFTPADHLNFSFGGRAGYQSLNKNRTFSPRTSASWSVTERMNVNLAGGIYRQALPLFLRSQQPEFDRLKDPRTSHIIAGIDYLLGQATKLTIEAYDKQYRNLPLQPEGYDQGAPAYVIDSQTFYEELTDRGTAFARGLDLMLQRKIRQGFYGSISASLFRSRYRDFNGRWQSREFDVGYLFNIIGGYRPNDTWEFSARWSYIGNRPYTPVDPAASAVQNRTIWDISRYHTEKMDAFHSLYARIDRRYFLSSASIVTFIELWNAYDRSNMYGVYWNRNTAEPAKSRQFDLLPVGGFIIEF